MAKIEVRQVQGGVSIYVVEKQKWGKQKKQTKKKKHGMTETWWWGPHILLILLRLLSTKSNHPKNAELMKKAGRSSWWWWQLATFMNKSNRLFPPMHCANVGLPQTKFSQSNLPSTCNLIYTLAGKCESVMPTQPQIAHGRWFLTAAWARQVLGGKPQSWISL